MAEMTEEEQEAFDAGEACAVHGPRGENCHFRFFGTPSLTAAWKLGKANAELIMAEDEASG